MDKPEKANLLLEGVENKLIPCLKTIVLMDSYGSDLLERGKKCGVEIISMKAMEVSHSALPTSLNSSSVEDAASRPVYCSANRRALS